MCVLVCVRVCVCVGSLFRGFLSFPRRPCERPPTVQMSLKRRAEDLLRDRRVVLRPLPFIAFLKRGPLPSGEPSIRMKQMSHYGSLQCVPARLILPSSWNVWEFLILWREEERVILGPVWLFINLPFPFFWEGVVIFLPLAHTEWEEQRYKDSEQSFFYCSSV